MNSRSACSIAALTCLVACAPAAPPPLSAIVAPAPSAPPPEAPPPLPVYVFNDAEQTFFPSPRIPLAEGAEGLVIEGHRVVMRDDEPVRVVAGDVVWSGGAEVPARLGGGVLLWTDEHLFRASAFEAPAVQLPNTVPRMTHVAFGPDFALLRSYSSDRIVVRLPSGDLAPARPLGILDVASLDDGRALAMTLDGRFVASSDGGKRWDATPGSAGRYYAGVHAAPKENALYVDSPGEAYRLGDDGHIADVATPTSRRFSDAMTARLAAVVNGTLTRDGGSAIAVLRGDVLRVDLRTGTSTLLLAKLVLERDRCTMLRDGEALLAVCEGSTGPTVRRGLFAGKAPPIEHAFKGGAQLLVSEEGSLLFPGSCGEPRDGAIACARDEAGAWAEETLPADVAKREGDVRWIPRRGAKAAAVVLKDGAARTYVPGRGLGDPWRDPEAKGRLIDAYDLLEGLGHSADRVVEESLTMLPDGSVAGYARYGRGFHVSYDGTLIWGPPALAGTSHHGRFVLGFANEREAFLSRDRGEHFEPIAAPPLHWTPHDLRCGEIGCALGSWLRLGWSATPPPAAAPQPPSRDTDRVQPTPRPTLSCVTRGPARQTKLTKPPSDKEVAGLGAHTLPSPWDAGFGDGYTYFGQDFRPLRSAMNPGRLLAVTQDPPPMRRSPPRLLLDTPPRRVDFVEPLNPVAPIAHTTIDLRPLLREWKVAQGLEDYSGSVNAMSPLPCKAPADGTGLVLSLPIARSTLLVAITGGTRPRMIAWGLLPNEMEPLSSVELSGGEVAVLLGTAFGGPERVVRLGKGDTPTVVANLQWSFMMDRRLPNPPSLAIGPDESLSILVTPTGETPATADDPALLFPLHSGLPVALAPWSTITDGNPQACSADPRSQRALVITQRTWVDMLPSRDFWGMPDAMLARVRWSESRACLEAIDTPRPSGTMALESTPTRTILRFPGSGSSRLTGEGMRTAIGLGDESREQVRCALAPPPGSPSP